MMQKIAICAPSHNFVGLYLHNLGTHRQSEKHLLSSNISPTCPYNMVNFGPLAAEIIPLVWGTPANFNGFRVLASNLLHSQTAALNRGRLLYSARRPSRWALATFLVLCILRCSDGKYVGVSKQNDASDTGWISLSNCFEWVSHEWEFPSLSSAGGMTIF